MEAAMRTGRRGLRGVAYLLLLLAVALIGLSSAAAIRLGAVAARRDAEQSLLAAGTEFQRALFSYAAVATSTTGRGPRTLSELLRDPRLPGVLRHLRQIYADPLTGKADWHLVTDQEGFIIGLYSVADGVPIKRAEFQTQLIGFEEAESYRDWVFGLPGAQKVRPTRASP